MFSPSFLLAITQIEQTIRNTHDVARLLTRSTQWRQESRKLGGTYNTSLSYSDPMPLVPNPLLTDILHYAERTNQQLSKHASELEGSLQPAGAAGADGSLAAVGGGSAAEWNARLPTLVRQMQELLVHVAAK